MRAIFDLVPVIAQVISAHCPGSAVRDEFMRACIHEDWYEARSLVRGMLAEPWLLRGYQEYRLREFLGMLPESYLTTARNAADQIKAD